MKIFHFKVDERDYYGVLKEESLMLINGEITGDFKISKESIPLSRAEILPPVKPGKIICISYNFPEHAKERGVSPSKEPQFFLKPPSSITSHLKPIIFPSRAKSLLFQGELGLILKRKARKLPQDFSLSEYILGFTAVNDVTAIFEGPPHLRWSKGKAYDTFTPIGPCILKTEQYHRLKLKTFVNAKIRQSASMGGMIFTPEMVIYYLSWIMTLEPYDLICLGTPGGVGGLKEGDRVDVQIEEIGTLSNQVIKEVTNENIP